MKRVFKETRDKQSDEKKVFHFEAEIRFNWLVKEETLKFATKVSWFDEQYDRR